MLALFVAQPASAQDDAIELEGVILYGDRTGTPLQQNGTSIAVVGADALAGPANLDIRDAFDRIANVSDTDWTDGGFVIRGVNSEGFTPGGAPLASFYVDGIQQTIDGTRRGARGVFDTEQLEIFRGPQSTLSGRAGLAGAIYLRTLDPDFSRSGAAQLTYGSDDRKQAGLAFGDALGDRLAYRIAGEYSMRDNDISYPTYESLERYDDFVTDDYWTLRSKLLWLPFGDETTRVLFTASRSYDSPAYRDIDGPGFGGSSFDEARGDYWGITGAPAYQEARSTFVNNYGIEVTHELSDALKLTAQTGWSRSLTDRGSINEGTQGEIYTTAGTQDQRVLSQEVRLNYDQGGLRWVLGAYAAAEDDEYERVSSPFPGRDDSSRSTREMQNQALFGEAGWELAPGWTVIAGGRLDRIDEDRTNFFSRNGVVSTNTSTTFGDTVFLPKLGFSHEFLDGQTIALTWQQGYRPGGSAVATSDGTAYSFDPEFAETLELGWRGQFMDDRLGLAANLFRQEWEDQQVEFQTIPGDFTSTRTINAASSRAYGAELEVSFAATDMLNIFASVGLLDTKFKDFAVDGYGDYSGLSFPEAPERSISVGFDWGADVGWYAGAVAKYQAESMSRLESFVAEPVMLDARTVVDAHVGYSWDQARMTLYANKLFDEEYFLYENGPDVLATLGDRREVGIRLDYRF